ncbi:ParB/RepB/Spo0J family partition protein [Ruminococcus bromii]|jgi:ParB family chromosome partitioning protein|nr:ParB/RepB/Spo0J family partition protein [Ruminococcus bromii]RGI71992.1 ParB/RepB/Spo0J family partition protein [Ruminococcus bromii]
MNKKSKLQMIPTDKLHPHPDNPRKVIGDVSELAESIKANGILQNLTVVPNDDNWDDFTVIIGHRRLAAAKQAGLTELPCAVVEMTEKEQLSTMLTENMQRSDLTVYEEAKGCQLLLDLGDTVAEVAKKTGFSESKIRRRVKLCELDEESFKESQLRQPTLADYERLNQIKNIEVRNELLKSIGTNNFDNLLYSAVKKQETDEEKEKIEKLCLEHGMIKAQKHDEIPSNYEYTGFFALKDLIGKDFADGRKRYFYFGYGSNIYIYAEAFEKQEKNDAEEEKRKLEEQRWYELVEHAEEIDKRCEALRIGFMLDTNFNDSSKKQELVKFIVAQVAAGASRNVHRFSEVVENQDAENIDSYINEHWDDNSGRMLMATAYALCQRTYEKLSFIYVEYSRKTISRKNSPDLNKFYALLCKLGYVMSDEEIQLRDGTHPIFTSGEVN